ncbi:MAG: M56 family metallopeptidase [Bacteroidetes bacterium]|nr:M56 family metallopeptidase [Bacteroidota bacterium]
MAYIINFLQDGGVWLWSAIWIPMLVWTLFALIALVCLNAQREKLHPTAQYYLRLSIFAALPAGLLLSAVMPTQMVLEPVLPLAIVVYDFITVPEVMPAVEASAWYISSYPAFIFGLINVLFLIGALAMLIRQFAHLRVLNRLRTALRPAPGHIAAVAQAYAGDKNPVQILLSDEATVPFTFGWQRPVVVLPDQQYSPDDLKSLLAHEIMHVRNGDFLIEWMVQLLRSVCWFHPLVQVYVRDIHRYREMSCDAEVLSGMTVDPRTYASLLLDFAGSNHHPRLSVMISMATPGTKLKERIQIMQHYQKTPENQLKIRNRTAFGSIASLVILTVVLALTGQYQSGSDLTAGTAAVFTQSAEPLDLPITTSVADTFFIVVEQMPEPIGGMQAIYNRVRYPESARDAGIEGRVVVQFIVDRQGNPQNIQVIRGIGGGADEAAMEAVRGVKFTPGMQRGQAVPVQFQLPIVFRLSNDGTEPPPPPPPRPTPPAPPAPDDLGPRTPSGAEIFLVVEEMPRMIGGMEAYYRQLRYPDMARRAGIEGRVILQFVVDTNGEVTNPVVLRGIGGGADEAALEALQSVRFTPGKQRGRNVHVQMQLPVEFRLSE